MLTKLVEPDQGFALDRSSILRGSTIEIKAEIFRLSQAPTKKGIPFFAIVGEEEIAAGKVNVKNLETGEQVQLDKDAIASVLA